MFKKAEASFWTAEMDLSKDVHDRTSKLNDNEHHFTSGKPKVCLVSIELAWDVLE